MTGNRGTAPSLALTLLRQGVPLTLLMDLVDPRGPGSRELLEWEASGARCYPRRARAASSTGRAADS